MTSSRANVAMVVFAGVLFVSSAVCSGADEAAVVSFEREPGKILISIGGRPFATYFYESDEITRPYFAHVKSPCGIQATRNHPPIAGKDETDHATYHPGVWTAFGDISGNDYWRLKAEVRHERFIERPRGGAGEGSFTVLNRYLNNAGDKTVCTEVCKYTILARPEGYLLIYEGTFSSDKGEFVFGDQEEFGLGIRVNTPISVRYGGQITNAEGDKDEKGTWGKASDWIDYSGVIDGKKVGMTIMPDTRNFRRSWYHARNYGFIAANPFGRKAMKQGPESEVVVKKGEKFHLGYGVLVHSSEAGEKVDLDAAYKGYLARTGQALREAGCRRVRLETGGLCAAASAAAKSGEVGFQFRPGRLLISIDGKDFAAYIYSNPEIPRPYFAHVKTPSGIQATRNHPPIPDKDDTDHSTFHPGIWLAFGDINGNDYWRLGAKVEHEMFVGEPEGGSGRGRFTVRNYYLDAEDKRMVLEVCKYTILARGGYYMIIYDSTFSSEKTDFTFGDQEEFGLGIRVNTPIAERYGGRIVNADGLEGAKKAWGKASDWCDYHGVIDETLIGMTIMPDPRNFRRSWYHARNYGFIAANPFGRKAMKQGPESKVVVKKGEKFHLGYGVSIYSAPKGAEIDRNAMYQDYLKEIGAKR